MMIGKMFFVVFERVGRGQEGKEGIVEFGFFMFEKGQFRLIIGVLNKKQEDIFCGELLQLVINIWYLFIGFGLERNLDRFEKIQVKYIFKNGN